MELKIKLYIDDYLAFQLFTASKSSRIKRKRNLEWLMTSSIFIVLALIFFLIDNSLLMYYFLIVSLLSLLLLPFYIRWRYRNHYLKHVKDVYKNNFGKEVVVKFTDEQIESFGSESESKVKYSQINEINETGTHYFVKFKSGHSLIIPKSCIGDIKDINNFFNTLAEKYQIILNQNMNWKWK